MKTTPFIAFEKAGGFFRLNRGVLEVIPMLKNGYMDASDPIEVDFAGIDSEDAKRCRAIQTSLENSVLSNPRNERIGVTLDAGVYRISKMTDYDGFTDVIDVSEKKYLDFDQAYDAAAEAAEDRGLPLDQTIPVE
jgi:hypothetical protein